MSGGGHDATAGGHLFNAAAAAVAGSVAIGGAITSATEGSVLFAGPLGVLAQDNSNFFWDDTNNALGIGTTTPNTNGKLSVFPDTDISAVIGRLKINCVTTTDHVLLSHFDLGTSGTTWQVKLDPDGDTSMQAVGVGSSVIVNAASTTGLVVLQGNSNARVSVNNTGIGFFGATPSARSTGWTAFTNGAVLKTCDTATVTLPQLAQLVGTLQAELVSKGLITT